MAGLRTLAEAWRRRVPGTVRLRLTALYGGLFLALGAVLLVITYGLVARQLSRRGGIGPPAPSDPPGLAPPARQDNFEAFRQRMELALAQQRADALEELLTQSVVALAIVSVIAVGLGWVVAGRVLRPLRAITATARRLSTHNLDQRINLRGPHDELTELADTFDDMLDRLAAAFEAQRRFVANASHELKTPLTVQRAAVDVALANPTVDTLRTMAERVRRAIRDHEHLVDSLLTLARSERGIERYADVDLASLVRTTLAAEQPRIEAGSLRVTHTLRPAPVRGDPVLLERLVANLIDNAVRHNTATGWIDIHTATDGTTTTLRVVNTGPVIPSDTVEALFEPFRRRPSARAADGHGHGLGLSIVTAIVTAHHGTRTAYARPDGGLDIVLTLPSSRSLVVTADAWSVASMDCQRFSA